MLGPVVHQGRLIVYSVHDDEQDLMERTGLDGALPPVEGDFLSLTTQNTGNSKIDVFLEPRPRLSGDLGSDHRSGGAPRPL